MRRLYLLVHVAAAAFAALAAGPATSAWLWRSDAGGLTRIETETGEVRALAGFPRADSVEADHDGGAWIRVGAELIRIDTDLNLSLRANLGSAPAPSSPMVWDPTARELWVAHEGDLLTYDEHLTLIAKRPQGDRISGLAIAGPRAIWIVAGTKLRQLDTAGRLVDAIDLGALVAGGAVEGLLVDPLRAKLWLVTDAELVALSATGGLALLQRSPIPAAARAAAIDLGSGDVLLHSGVTWYRSGEWTTKSSARDVVVRGDTTSVLRFAARTRPSVELAVSAPIEFFRGNPASDRVWLIAPRASIEVVAVNSRVGGVEFRAAQFLVQPEAYCDASRCIGADALLDGVKADAIFDQVPVAGHAFVSPTGDRTIAIEFGVLQPNSIHSLTVALEDAYGNRSEEERWSVTVGADGQPVLSKVGPKALPVVSITAPANNASFVAPASITINATATESGGTITKVEFYRNGVLLGTDTTSPYSYAWTGVAVGTYALTAKAYDSTGGSTTSATVNAQVKANVAPTVSLTAPANNATFVAPAAINFAASASDTDGTVSKVEFYNGATLLGTDTTSPYTYAWASVAVGTYSLTAKAYDNLGATTASSAVSVQVKANVAPTVTLTSPANNAAYTAPATVSLAATASDTDGTVAKVAFYNGATLLATINTAPYTYTWSNVAGGSYSLTAKATDDKGAVTTSAARAITVNKPPTVSLTAPATGATFAAPATINLAATAADADGTIAKVEFYQGATLLGTDTTSPYNYIWNNVAVGSYTLTAKSTDNKGASTTSAPITVTVNPNKSPAITISSPADGTTYVAPATINVVANASDPDGTINKVQFYWNGTLLMGTDTTSPYSVQWVGVGEGPLQIIAKATDNLGAVTTSPPITVNVLPNTPPIITLTGTPAAGDILFLTPPTIHLAATAVDIDGSIAEVRFYALDPATLQMALVNTVTQPPYEFDWSDPSVGSAMSTSLQFYAEAVDNGGAVSQSNYLNYDLYVDREPTPHLAEPHSSPDTFTAPATIVLVATVGDPDIGIGAEGIAKVEFLEGANVLASFSAPNGGQGEFVWVWRNPPVGSHSITVRATDSLGVTADTGLPADIRVVPAFVPATVAVVQPAAGTSYGSSVPLQATVTGGGAPIARVDFVNAIGSVAASVSTTPYTATWTGAPVGSHSMTAQAVDSYGNVAISPTVFFNVVGPNIALPQAVVLTAPLATSTYAASVPITLAADLLDPAKVVTSVKFYANGSLIGSVSTAPYSVVFSNPWSGTYPLSVVASDGLGHNVSDAVTITFANNNASPTVSVTAPANGATFAAPATIGLAATASDPDGTITKVEFYAGATKVGTATSSPFTATWSSVSAGTYLLTATATDNKGSVTTSAARTITVTTNAAPQITLTAPANGQSFAFGATISVSATALDPDGVIGKIEFFDGAILIGTVSAAPYTLAWSGASVGTHSVTAKATDNSGASTSTTAVVITVTANLPPGVTLALPQDGQIFPVGATIPLIATAYDADGSVVRVEFVANGTLLGSASAAPYRFDWTNAAVGSYTVLARAVDNRGATVNSAAISIQVIALALTITAPVANSTIPADFVLVTGTYQAPPNSGVTVNGVVARNDGAGHFFVNNFPLVDGANTIEVTLTTSAGQTMTQSQTVTRNGMAPMQVSVDSDGQFAPGTFTIRVENRTGNLIASIAYPNLSGGQLDTSNVDQQTLGTIAYLAPGLYQPGFAITDSAGNVYMQSVGLLAQDKSTLDHALRMVWRGFGLNLFVGDIQKAMEEMSASARIRYAPVLNIVAPSLANAVTSWSVPQQGAMSNEIAEYAVHRIVGGVKRLYFVYLVVDRNGIWRLDSM